MNIKDTFCKLVQYTYPYGTESKLLPYLPKLKQDKYGNYYTLIGNTTTMFTSHLDNFCTRYQKVEIRETIKDSEIFIKSKSDTILGADGKAGVTIMINMIENNIPGLYYFFIGEEKWGLGSMKVAENFFKEQHVININKVISFDRREYGSIITHQMDQRCCSPEFALSLGEELFNNGLYYQLDPTGMFTDSANFIDVVPECTNLSVGYFDEHTENESINITFLEKLAKATLKINWEDLPIRRNLDNISNYSDFYL